MSHVHAVIPTSTFVHCPRCQAALTIRYTPSTLSSPDADWEESQDRSQSSQDQETQEQDRQTDGPSSLQREESRKRFLAQYAGRLESLRDAAEAESINPGLFPQGTRPSSGDTLV